MFFSIHLISDSKGAMPAGGRALLALGLLALGCAAAARPPPADNDFPEGGPERRRPPGPAPACPRDCGCSQEGVVDCGGIDLKEFPLLLPELTNHLSLQNNQIEEIFPEELARLYRLETLNLQNNRLTSKGLPEEAFEHLENLNYLYLANNK